MIIYKITNSINGKVYIGQTVQKNPKMRWYDHQAKARCGVNQPLFNAIRKYGVENFTWEVIDQANSLEELNKLEEQFVEQYNSIHTGYNIRKAGGNKLHNASSIEKMRQKQRDAHARRRDANGGVEVHSQHKQHESGWKHSAESRQKRKEWSAITNKLKAKPLTEEHKHKVSESGKLAWVKRKLKLEGGTQN
jgi:group I intron endonuclease